MSEHIVDHTEQYAHIKEGKQYRLTTNVGAVGYAHDSEPQYMEFGAGHVVVVNKVVEDLYHGFGRWPHTIIVSSDEESVDDDGDEVEISFTAFVGAEFLVAVEEVGE